MCGRFAFTKEKEAVKSRFSLDHVPRDWVPLYNIAPTQMVPAILNETPRDLTLVRWGLVPHWAKEEKMGYKMINARAETVAEKPTFKKPLQRQRCLILADSFYEWKKEGARKRPYRVFMKDQEAFAMAGIWDIWKAPEKTMITCSIITTGANALMKPLHERMPVILPRAQEHAWLQDLPLEEITAMLKPFDAAAMEAYEIRPLVNSPANNTPEVLKPLNPTLF